MKKNIFPSKIDIKNKKAYFEYKIMQKYIAGISLYGTEIKSIRQGKASLIDSYCYITKNELYVKQLYIAPYEFGTSYNHEERRVRKLLLKRHELQKLLRTKERGMTIIPLRLFISSRGFAKLEIALAKGKKLYDKRQQIKERDIKRQLARSSKY